MATWSRTLKVGFALVLLVAVATFVVQAFPVLVGADHSLIVQSGSMEPAIQTGAIAFVAEDSPDRVREGDVITYQDGGGNLITHRVVEKHQTERTLRFVTKGDNNEEADPEPVYRDEYVGKVLDVDLPLVGRVLFTLPLVGRFVAFGRSSLGYATFVLVPCLVLIFSEIWNLYRAMQPEEEP